MAVKILIAGAGIGGLTAALCLQKAGYRVQVFEQAPKLEAVGAGVQLGANAMAVLDYLGLACQLKPFCVVPESINFCAFDSGAVLYKMGLGSLYQQRYGAPYAHIHRADLHAVLRDNFHGELRLGAEVTAYREHRGGVVLKLANGEALEGDLLIAADGIHSGLRAQLLGQSEPQWSGAVAWRATLPATDLPPQWLPLQSTNFVGPGKHMVVYPLRNRELVNFVGIVEKPSAEEFSWAASAPWQELKADFAGWHPLVQALIDALPREACSRWVLCDHKPVAGWSHQRVTLLGDAAHAALPFMASGAAMAIEDARVLQRALQQSLSIADALQCYQRNRIARTAKVQRLSRRAGHLYHIRWGWLQRQVFRSLGLLTRPTEDFLPRYNANTVELI